MILTDDDFSALNPDGNYQVLITPEQKQQILENQEKAEELDDLKKRFIVIGNMIDAMETIQKNNTKLEQENKQLGENYDTLSKYVDKIKPKAAEWDKVVTNPDYIEQTENALRELRHDNIQLLEASEKDHRIIVHANTQVGNLTQKLEKIEALMELNIAYKWKYKKLKEILENKLPSTVSRPMRDEGMKV